MGMQKNIPLQNRALALIEQLRQTLIAPGLVARHRRRATDFTRERVLTFPVLMLLLLQKSLKSLQTHVHEFLHQLADGNARPKLSGGALTHARAKLRASAFIELNAAAVLATVYGPEHAALVQRWQGHRLLGVDSSLVRLPSRAAVGEAFGWVQCANQSGPLERYPQARVSVLYDVLNQVGLEGRLAASTVAETELAHQHLAAVQPEDVLLNDRGYTGYRWLVAVRAARAHFVSRCSRGSFAAVQELFARDQADVSVVVTLAAPPGGAGRVSGAGLAADVDRAAGHRAPVERGARSAGHLAVGRGRVSDRGVRPGVLAALGPRDVLRAFERALGPGTLQRPGGGAGFSRDRVVEQRREPGGGRGPGGVGGAHGRAAAAGAGESRGEFACDQVSVDPTADEPGAGGAGPGGTDRVVSSQSGECASRSHGAAAQVLPPRAPTTTSGG